MPALGRRAAALLVATSLAFVGSVVFVPSAYAAGGGDFDAESVPTPDASDAGVDEGVAGAPTPTPTPTPGEVAPAPVESEPAPEEDASLEPVPIPEVSDPESEPDAPGELVPDPPQSDPVTEQDAPVEPVPTPEASDPATEPDAPVEPVPAPVESEPAIEPDAPVEPAPTPEVPDPVTEQDTLVQPAPTPDTSDPAIQPFVQPFADDGTVALGDFVWFDEDGDGVQDAGESGIPGVTVTLTDFDGFSVIDSNGEEVGPATTDGDGLYYFGSLWALNPGEFYTVTVDPASPVLAVYDPTVTGAGDPATDSSTGSANSGEFVDGLDSSLDFGFVLKPVDEPTPKVSVGDFAWIDSDSDGLQDAGELGLAGVRLTLTGPDGGSVTDVFGTPVDPITTGTSGAYSFNNLPALPAGEHYTVRAMAPSGFTPTLPEAGADRALDSSMDTATSGDLELDGARDATLDFGFTPPQDDDDTGTAEPGDPVKPSAYVGNFVWRDVNKNGLQDDGETGIAGVRMTLTRSNGSPVTDVYGKPVAPRVTDKDGYYVFGDLPLGGAFTVTIDSRSPALANYVPTKAGAGDRWYDSSTGSVTSIKLVNDLDYDYTLDFGFVPSPPKVRVSVGNSVWFDANKNGRFDSGEAGISGVRLNLVGPDGRAVTNVNGIPVGTATTNAYGWYTFADLRALPAGQHYTVKVDATSPGLTKYMPTTPGVGSADGNSSTGSAASSDLLTNGASDLSLDFGFVLKPVSKPSVAVGNFVWVDSNKNGRQDAGEPGIAGARLTLVGPGGVTVKNVGGTVVGPVTTNSSGYYSFSSLPPLAAGSRYTVRIDATSSVLLKYTPTTAGVGDRVGNSSTGSAASTDLVTGGASDSTLDFGFVPKPTVAVGNFVWVDSNKNGRQDTGEPGIAGVRLTLVGPGGVTVKNVSGAVVGPVTTNASGYYSFASLRPLPAGSRYTVRIDATSTVLSKYTPTTAGVGDRVGNSSTGAATSLDLVVGGASDSTLDFGFIPKPLSDEPVPEPTETAGVTPPTPPAPTPPAPTPAAPAPSPTPPAPSPTAAAVPAPSAASSGGGLAATGASGQPVWAAGAMLLGLGILVLVGMRRRSGGYEKG